MFLQQNNFNIALCLQLGKHLGKQYLWNNVSSFVGAVLSNLLF